MVTVPSGQFAGANVPDLYTLHRHYEDLIAAGGDATTLRAEKQRVMAIIREKGLYYSPEEKAGIPFPSAPEKKGFPEKPPTVTTTTTEKGKERYYIESPLGRIFISKGAYEKIKKAGGLEEIQKDIERMRLQREFQAVIHQAVESTSMGLSPVPETTKEMKMRLEEERKIEEIRRKDLGYQIAFGAKKIITGEALGAGISVLAAEGIFGKGEEEAADWRKLWTEEQRKELYFLGKGKREEVFLKTAVEVAPAVAIVGLGAGLQGISVGAKGAKIMTGVGLGVTGLGTGIAVLEAPKLNIKDVVSRTGAGALIATGGLAITYGGIKAMKATKPKTEYGEVLAVRRERITPRATLRKMQGYLTKTKLTRGFGVELKREVAPKNLFAEGRLVTKRGLLEVWKLKDVYFKVFRGVSGKAISGGELIDVARIDKQSFLKTTGVDVFMKESISVPISFETGKGFKVTMFKSTGIKPSGTGLKGIGTSLKSGFKQATVSVKNIITPITKTSISPVIVPSLTGTISKQKQAYKIQPVSITTTKQKLKQKVTPIITGVSLQQQFKGLAQLVSPIQVPFLKPITTPFTTPLTTPITTPITTPARTPIQTPRFDMPPARPVKIPSVSPPVLLPPFLPFFNLGSLTDKKRKRKGGYKRRKKYAPSIAGISFKTKFKMPKVELGIRMRGVKKRGKR